MMVNLKGVNKKRKNGKTYYYFRGNCNTCVSLMKYGKPEIPQNRKEEQFKEMSPEFINKVNELNLRQEETIKNHCSNAGTLNWLISKYEASNDFKQISPRTRKNYIYWFSRLSSIENIPYEFFDEINSGRDLVQGIQNKFYDKPTTANEIIGTLKTLFSWAVRMGYMENNPCKTFVRKLKNKHNERIWTSEELHKWLEAAEKFSDGIVMKASLLLGFYTGQRQADILEAKWDQYDGRMIYFVQNKTGARVNIAVNQELKKILDSLKLEKRGEFIVMYKLVGKKGYSAFKQDYFKHRFLEITRKAGLDGLNFRMLRPTTTTALNKLGISAQQLSDVTGHSIKRSAQILDVYSRHNEALSPLKLGLGPEETKTSKK